MDGSNLNLHNLGSKYLLLINEFYYLIAREDSMIKMYNSEDGELVTAHAKISKQW